MNFVVRTRLESFFSTRVRLRCPTSLHANFRRHHRRGRVLTLRRAGLRPPVVVIAFLCLVWTFANVCQSPI